MNAETSEFEYLINWVNFNDDWNTWEPAESLPGCEEVLDEFEDDAVDFRMCLRLETEIAAAKEVCNSLVPWHSQLVCYHRRNSSGQRLHGYPGKLCKHPNSRRAGTRSGWQMVKWFAVAATLQSNAAAATKTGHTKATICARTLLRVAFDSTQTKANLRGGGRVAADSCGNCAATMIFQVIC